MPSDSNQPMTTPTKRLSELCDRMELHGRDYAVRELFAEELREIIAQLEREMAEPVAWIVRSNYAPSHPFGAVSDITECRRTADEWEMEREALGCVTVTTPLYAAPPPEIAPAPVTCWTQLAAVERERTELQAKLATAERDAAYRLWRLKTIFPLFEEARDALPAITTVSAKLHGVRLDLTDRMDRAGTATRADFEAIQSKRKWLAKLSKDGSK